MFPQLFHDTLSLSVTLISFRLHLAIIFYLFRQLIESIRMRAQRLSRERESMAEWLSKYSTQQ